MKRDQYYLMKLAEECSEVAQRALKQVQFGKEEVQKGQDLTNGERLRLEIMDLLTVIDVLESENHIPFMDFDLMKDHMTAKKYKLEKYMDYSRCLERVK